MPHLEPAAPAGAGEAPSAPSAPALRYLEQCLTRKLPCALLTGPPEGTAATLDRLVDDAPALRIARLAADAPDGRAFVAAVLDRFGFGTVNAPLEDLEQLLALFITHQAGQGRRVAILVEHVDAAVPPVIERLRVLLTRLASTTPPPATLVLTGGPGLEALLDAPAMADVAPWLRARHRLAPRPAACAVPEGPAELVVTLDGHVVQRHRLRPGRLLLGRHEDNDVTIVSRYVSRHHALFVQGPHGAYIVDLNSTNGICVNGRVVTQRILDNGDIVSIGNFRIRYHGPGPAADVAEPAGSADSTADTVVMRSHLGIGGAPAGATVPHREAG